jgi:hypothetical protein
MRIPTAYCASACPKDWTCLSIRKMNSTPSCLKINQRPRARFGFASLLAFYTAHMEQLDIPEVAVNSRSVAVNS